MLWWWLQQDEVMYSIAVCFARVLTPTRSALIPAFRDLSRARTCFQTISLVKVVQTENHQLSNTSHTLEEKKKKSSRLTTRVHPFKLQESSPMLQLCNAFSSSPYPSQMRRSYLFVRIKAGRWLQGEFRQTLLFVQGRCKNISGSGLAHYQSGIFMAL